MSDTSRAWIKPVIAAVAIAAIGFGAYATFPSARLRPS
jgi:hypothetical protein